ncbi:MAG: winged helix-turn-helix domain-containing protein, partial [Campylobacterales bacterium]|nr:winged helix-turn-helix domain-containing protein [Campylobacterales bacterium]
MYEGESSTNISFLQSGLARVYKMDKFGNEIFLYHIYKHQLITELSALNENVITCVSNISIDEDTIIIDIDFNKFRDDFIYTNILTTNFLQEVFAKTQKLQCVVNRELVFDSMAKVAHFLSENLEMFNKLKRTEVALLLHLQPETLSRVVKKLQRQELIGMEVKKVFIVDEDGLKNIFQGV